MRAATALVVLGGVLLAAPFAPARSQDWRSTLDKLNSTVNPRPAERDDAGRSDDQRYSSETRRRAGDDAAEQRRLELEQRRIDQNQRDLDQRRRGLDRDRPGYGGGGGGRPPA